MVILISSIIINKQRKYSINLLLQIRSEKNVNNEFAVNMTELYNSPI